MYLVVILSLFFRTNVLNCSTPKSDLKFKIFKNEINTDLYAYVFVTAEDCSIHLHNINETIRQLNDIKDLKISCFCFVSEIDTINRAISKLFTQKMQLIPDELDVYADYYKAQTSLSVLLIDASGNVVYTNGLSRIDDTKILKCIDEYRNTRPQNQTNIVKIQSSNDWIFNKSIQYLYSANSNLLYLFVGKSKSIYVVDNKSGKIIDTIKIPLKNTISILSPQWTKFDSSIMFIHNSYDNYREYIQFDLKSQKITRFEAEALDSLLSPYSLHTDYYYIPEKMLFITNLYRKQGADVKGEYKNIFYYNKENRISKLTNNIDEFYLNMPELQFESYSSFYYRNDKIYSIDNLNSSLNIYSANNFNEESSKKLKNNRIVQFISKVDSNIIDSYWGGKIDHINKILFADENNLYVSYYKIKSLPRRKFERKYTLAIINKSSGEFIKEYEIDEDYKPFYCDGKILKCSAYIKKQIFIKTIDL
jgi:hypothetical protein